MAIMNKTVNQAIRKGNVPAISLAMPIKEKPYKHQQDAFDFVCYQFRLTDEHKKSNGVALLMEMGTGKTLDALKKKINLAKMLIDEYRGGKNPLAA